jgi:hypothetical protein
MNIQTHIEEYQAEGAQVRRETRKHTGLKSLLTLPKAINRALSGRPMTERERIKAALAESQIRYVNGPFR